MCELSAPCVPLRGAWRGQPCSLRHRGAQSGLADLHIVKNGRPHDTDEARASELLKQKDIVVSIDLGLGECS